MQATCALHLAYILSAGVRNIVLGSAHRGRLNILTELLGYSYTALFHKIKGNCEFPAELNVSGDVASHLGGLLNFAGYHPENLTQRNAVASSDLSYEGSPEPIKVSLLPNPSHLGGFTRFT